LGSINGASYTTDKAEGSHAVSLNGSNQALEMAFSSSSKFPSDAYGTRTVAVWIKPNSTSQSNKIIFEFGGSSNGLAMRLNNGTIQAGISRSSTRHSVSVTLNSGNGWQSGAWNHVATVYNGTQLKLFINGVERGSVNLSSTSTKVGANSNLSRIGGNVGNNAFNSSTSSTNFNGLIDEVVVLSQALNEHAITAIMNGTFGKATTLPAPPAPAVPSGVTATPLSTTSIQVQWNDLSTDETGFELYRSVGNTNGFRLLKLIEAGNGGVITYTDDNLFANTNYYYKVVAKGVSEDSDTSAVAFAKTLNNAPVIRQQADVMMRYGSYRLPIGFFATDVDGDAITMTIENKPSFVTFIPGNGVATLAIPYPYPSQAQIGVYPITVRATDAHGGTSTTTFNLTVNENYVPTIFPPQMAVSVNEGATLNVNINAQDADGNASLVWSIAEGPSFAMLTANSNGAGVLTLTPSYAQAGSYVITLLVRDDIGAEAEMKVSVTVNNVELADEAVYMSTVYYSEQAPAPWNNLISATTNNLVNSEGVVTPIGIDFLNTPWNAGNAGAVTNNNSGIYPDVVIRDYFWFGIYGAPETVTMRLRGLDVNSKYNVTLFGSSAWTGVGNNGTTVYTINGVNKPLYVDNNNQNTVTFDNIVPDANGYISVQMSKGANTPYGMVNAIVLQKTFSDGTAPVLPEDLAAEALENGSIKLTWKDIAYNESRYLVHRSNTIDGPYTVINPGASNTNSTSYIDNSVVGNTTYYYKIEAENEVGSSGLTEAVSVTSVNKAPVLNNVIDQVINGGASLVVNLTASDEVGDVITFEVNNLPHFAQFQNTGNGTASITFNPGFEDIGQYNDLYVKATDQNGAFTTLTFSLTVVNPNIKTVMLSLGSSSATARAPWNNGLTWPTANVLMSNLRDLNGLGTSFGVRLNSTWNGVYDNGMVTGGNRGIYNDDVIKGAYLSNSTSGRVIQIEGLDQAKRYNIGVFSSNNSGIESAMTITSGSQTVAVDGRYNSIKTGYLTGLTPNSQGIIQITLNKNSGSDYIMLNGIVIEEYNASTFVNPFDLFAETVLEPNKIKLSWSDRSSGESGFQIWRSTSKHSGYTLLATTSANVTTYTDGTANANTRYYYKVRAVNGSSTSAYSNIATNILSNSIVKINFNANAAQNAPSPWNNTNGPSSAGLQFTKLVNQNNINSGITMEITKEFNGPGFAGINSASGVLPGVVMESNYWTDAGQLSQVKFTNLALNKRYRIGIFGSAVFYGNAVASYKCNGEEVFLNSISNTTKVVYLENLVPDENGELYLDVRTVSGYPYSFTGALTIEGYVDDGSVGKPDETPQPSYEYVKTETVKFVDKVEDNYLNVYPNPFTDRFNVELNTEQTAQVSLMLFDLSGNLVYEETGHKTIQGINRIPVEIAQKVYLVPGTYFLSVIRDGKPLKAVKLLKIN
jgi:hypothetical protein